MVLDLTRLEECTIYTEGIYAQYQQEMIALQLCYESALEHGELDQQTHTDCVHQCHSLGMCEYTSKGFDTLVEIMFTRDSSGHSQLNSAAQQETLQRVRNCMDGTIGQRSQQIITILGVTVAVLLLWILQSTFGAR